MAAAKSSSAFLYAIPPSGGSRLSALSVSCGCFCGQPGGQQRRAAVDGEVGVGLAERVVAIPCLVEVGERLGKVAADKRHASAVVPGLGVLEFLPAGGEQFLGPGVVRGRAPGQAEPDEDLGSMGQRPGLPYRVACPAEVGQGAAQVLMCLVETAQLPEDGGTPHEHAAGQVSARGGHRPVQQGQPLLAAAGPREGQPQGRLHVDLTLGPAGRAGQPQALPQLGDRFREVCRGRAGRYRSRGAPARRRTRWD